MPGVYQAAKTDPCVFHILRFFLPDYISFFPPLFSIYVLAKARNSVVLQAFLLKVFLP